jgi:hypothetical protein
MPAPAKIVATGWFMSEGERLAEVVFRVDYQPGRFLGVLGVSK